MPRREGDRICEEFYVAAYWGACVSLGIAPAGFVLAEMARLTQDTRQAMAVIEVMKDAAQWDRVTAALRLLRAEYVQPAREA